MKELPFPTKPIRNPRKAFLTVRVSYDEGKIYAQDDLSIKIENTTYVAILCLIDDLKRIEQELIKNEPDHPITFAYLALVKKLYKNIKSKVVIE